MADVPPRALERFVQGRVAKPVDNMPAHLRRKMCYLGWQESRVALAKLVEPDIRE